MDFREVLHPETIITHLGAENKDEALRALTSLFAKNGIISNEEGYLKDVYLREAEGETGIGDYIAIPHGKSASVITPGVAVGVLDQEIEWETLDGEGVRVVILFAVGTDSQASRDHLKMLAMFSKRLGDDAVLDRLLHADTVNDVLSAFEETDEEDSEEVEEEELDLDDLMIV